MSSQEKLTTYVYLGKQKITDQIAQLKYKEPNSPRIVVLEQELVRAEAESLVAEAQLSNITREKLKAAFTYQFDALKEHSEKLAIIAGFGKHLLELVDDTPVTPGETREAYDGYEASKAYVSEYTSINTLRLVLLTYNTVSSRTAKMLSQTGSLPTQLSNLPSARAPVTFLSVVTSKWVKVSTYPARTKASRIARAAYGCQQAHTVSIKAMMRKKRRRRRRRLRTARRGDVKKRDLSRHRKSKPFMDRPELRGG